MTVYDGIDLAIERGARIALVGPNGAGKSTMMKLLAGIEPMTAGERTVGAGVEIGYFAQNLAESLDYSNTALKELQRRGGGDDHRRKFVACWARCCFRATTR